MLKWLRVCYLFVEVVLRFEEIVNRGFVYLLIREFASSFKRLNKKIITSCPAIQKPSLKSR